MNNKIYRVEKSDFFNMRLDKYLALKNKDLSRSYIKRLIDEERVTVNKGLTKGSYKIRKGDLIELKFPEPVEMKIKAVDMNLDIIYEDSDILVVNKPPGLVVHPVPGNYNNTLVNGLLSYTDDLSGINGIKRPGIVHRLDKDTSGVLIVAKNDQSHRNLVQQFKNRTNKKIYHALLKGYLPHDQGIIKAPIGRDKFDRKKMAVVKENSKEAVSRFSVIERFDNYTYVEVKIETGRTHQIRVHFAYLGYPIVGDLKYGKKIRDKKLLFVTRQMLHAYQLGVKHPIDGKWMEFKAVLPDDFNNILTVLREKS
ncbi:RluA family pseudouridine synthase [Iocasia frigidifontis]|uniref:Pseudouridine synthase n=1 Tax=Iocasia fonsfrigidae TaxID=2682810 RepID=A0A8A7K8P0_9FIRM|nr:RluA family pseudouridine synthase [Iocasia fonsfrigidae]QTL98116.1 RluA family pseudouridine synthase [Iocasia fonsfrigidae]